MKALGAIEIKWDHIRKKLARRLLEEQDKVLRSYFAQKGGQKGKRSCVATAAARACWRSTAVLRQQLRMLGKGGLDLLFLDLIIAISASDVESGSAVLKRTGVSVGRMARACMRAWSISLPRAWSYPYGQVTCTRSSACRRHGRGYTQTHFGIYACIIHE